METTTRLKSSQLYTVGWIAALPHELAAATAMLDEKHTAPEYFETMPHDTNHYTWGRIGGHNVVVASLPVGRYGTVPAADTASQMRSSLPHLRFGLMVGIGAGVPKIVDGQVMDAYDVRLGDVVVSQPTGTSPGVVQYDLGKDKGPDYFELVGYLSPPPDVLLRGLGALQAKHITEDSRMSNHLNEMLEKYPKLRNSNPERPGFIHPGPQHDRLFHASSDHITVRTSQGASIGNTWEESGPCSSCDSTMEIKRPERRSTQPRIHYGVIASGNQVVKNGISRDKIFQRLGYHCHCFEMEAAGLMNNFPCLVIRGICDYADTHKNDLWQNYAATTAAAFAKELLETLEARTIENEPISIGEYIRAIRDDTSQMHAMIHESQVALCTVDKRTEVVSSQVEDIQPTLEREVKNAFADLEPFLDRRFESFGQALVSIRDCVVQTNIGVQRIQPSPMSTSTSTVSVNSGRSGRKDLSLGRRRPLPCWNLSVFNFPIGTLVVETQQDDLYDDGFSSGSATPRGNYVAFRFKPKPWISDGIFSVENFFTILARNAPVWQRIQRRVPSLLPQSLITSVEETDLLQLGSLLASCSPQILRLVFDNFLCRRRDRLSGGWSCTLSLGYVIDFNIYTQSPSVRNGQTYGHLWYHREGNIKFKPSLFSPCFTARMFPKFIKSSLLGGPDERPTIFVSANAEGYEFLLQHICPCFDSFDLEEFNMIDRWWLSALNHEDPRFGDAIRSHLSSFEGSSDRQVSRMVPVDPGIHLNYGIVVKEVLAANHPEQQNFLLLVYAYGTFKCLRPFLDAGHNPSTTLTFDLTNPTRITFHQVAVRAWNISVLKGLQARGTRLPVADLSSLVYSIDNICPNLAKSREVLNTINLIHSDESGSVFSLVYEYCKTEVWFKPEYSGDYQIFESDLKSFAKELLGKGMGCYSHPPYLRSLFLGPELLVAILKFGHGCRLVPRLLSLGASLDYVGPSFLSQDKKRTAIEWAIDLGLADIVLVATLAQKNFEERDASLQAALRRAESYLNCAHPRRVSVEGSTLPCSLDPSAVWEARALLGPDMRTLSSLTVLQRTQEVSRTRDVLSFKILECAIFQNSEIQTKTVEILRKIKGHHEKSGSILFYDKDDEQCYSEIVGSLAELIGVKETPKRQAPKWQHFKLIDKLWSLRRRVYHYWRWHFQMSWKQAALGAVGLVVCLRAVLEHMFYEFLAWLWIQRGSLKLFRPLLLFSLAFILVSWLFAWETGSRG